MSQTQHISKLSQITKDRADERHTPITALKKMLISKAPGPGGSLPSSTSISGTLSLPLLQSCFTCQMHFLNFISKSLATPIETVLPALVHQDRAGFIKGTHSSNNMHRLYSVIHVAQQQLESIIVSLDTVLGSLFRFLYSSPMATVATNRLISQCFTSTWRPDKDAPSRSISSPYSLIP